MKKKSGYKSIPLSFNRRAVIASVSVANEKNIIDGAPAACFVKQLIEIVRSGIFLKL